MLQFLEKISHFMVGSPVKGASSKCVESCVNKPSGNSRGTLRSAVQAIEGNNKKKFMNKKWEQMKRFIYLQQLLL